MTVVEALENALTFLEAAGYRGGDIHDDLETAIKDLKWNHPKIAREELGGGTPD